MLVSLATIIEPLLNCLKSILVPNLVETVKGYAKHEKGVLTEVTKARTQMMNAGTVQEKAQAENFLSETLKSLFAVFVAVFMLATTEASANDIDAAIKKNPGRSPNPSREPRRPRAPPTCSIDSAPGRSCRPRPMVRKE